MQFVAAILAWVIQVYLLFFFGRFVLDLVLSFNRGWKPKGFLLVLAEITMTLTDPPLRLARRFIPNIRVGMLAFDLSFGIVWLLLLVLQRFAQLLAG